MSDDVKKPLTRQREVFVEEYLTCWNGAEAARRAGYSARTASEQASRLLTIVSIQERVQRRMEEKTMKANEVLFRLHQQASGTLKHFVVKQGDNVVPDLSSDEADSYFHLLKKVKFKVRSFDEDKKYKGKEELGGDAYPEKGREVEVETEIEIHDPQAALVHLGRHYKLFTDNTEVSGPNGSAVPVAIQFIPYARTDTDNS